MRLTVRLFVQRHENRTYTVSVPIFAGLAAYGPTLEECKQEVAEALAKRLAEIDPDLLHLYAFKPNQSLEKVTVDLRPTDRNSRRRRNMIKLSVSLLLSPEEDGQLLVSAPRLRQPPLTFYVANREELAEVAQLELAQYFHEEPVELILAAQASRYESLDTLEVEFRPKKATDKDDEQEEESFWALKASGVNLTAQAAEGQLRRAFRREAIVEQVLSALAGDRRPSLMLIGPSGAGKTAIVHEIARRIRKKECAEVLHDRQVWSVTAASLIAGCSYLGQWQDKLNDLVREVRKKRHLLFIEDVAALAEAGRWSKGDENMAEFLKPHLLSGDVVLIGETNPERLRRLEQLAPGFAAQLRTIEVAPPGETDTLSILAALARELERAEDLRIEPSALEAAVELTTRFMPYRAQPGKSIALIEQLAGDASRARTSAGARPLLTRREVIGGFTRQTGLPEFMVADSLPLDLAAVHAHFSDRIVGQESAAEAMVDLIAMVKAGLNDTAKPLGVYLFIGPTGVGKTQLAKTLAAYLFGDEQRMLRFDMSEYSDPAAIRRLIGVPGAGRDGGEGELTRRVRAQPFCVLLLDEFEKADPQIYDVLLQVLGEGHLTDAAGQTTAFQNAIIIMTSNLGAAAREQRSMGLSADSSDDNQPAAMNRTTSSYWQRRVEEHFRPEFVNRIDQIVVFKPLESSAMHKIASREIGDVLLRQGLVRRNVLVEVDQGVLDLLIEQGFTASYGARPLKRAIERLVVLPLARFLAARERPGADLLRLRRINDQIELQAVSMGASEQIGASESSTAERGVLDVGQLSRRKVDDKSLSDGFAELRRKLHDWNEREAIVAMRDERATCLAETNKPTFWDDGDKARATLARFYTLERLLKRLQQLTDRAEYLEELSTLVHRQRDPRYRAELADGYERLHRDLAFLEVELLCAHLTDNHRAVLRIRRIGPPQRDEGQGWATQLAAMYLHWASRKGYELELYVLEALDENARRNEGLIAQYYPYRWQTLDISNIDGAIRQLLKIDDPIEIAIGMGGTNVYGFMKGESGVHRRSDRRPSGERTQRMAEVDVKATGGSDADIWLEKILLQRAWDEQERAQLTPRQREKLPQPSEPEVVRVYQVEGERLVRDLRTQIKTTSVGEVLEGALDDFILAYLREEETKQAWRE